MMRKDNNLKKNKGFTIVEVLVATSVFSLVLVLVIGSVLSFSNHYYKSSDLASAQSSARTILSDVTSAIEFSDSGGGPIQGTIPASSENYLCAGSIEFYYYTSRPQTQNNAKNAIWEDTNVAACNTSTVVIPSSSSELLLGYGETLSSLTVSPISANLYSVTVDVAYYGGSSTTTDNAYCGRNGLNCHSTLTEDVQMRYGT